MSRSTSDDTGERKSLLARLSSWSRHDKGAVALEFALVVPWLLLIIYGTVELGLAFQAQLAVTTAAREGARMAAAGEYNASTVQSRAWPCVGAGVAVTGLDGDRGTPVSVTVSYNYVPLILRSVAADPQYRLGGWSGTIALSSTATMRNE